MNSNDERTSKAPWMIGGVALIAALVCIAVLRQPKPAPLAEVPHRELTQTNGLWYRQAETNPFTGIMLDVYPEGAIMARSVISNGLPNGLYEVWYTNGQIQLRQNFANGLSDGRKQEFYENGAKKSEAVLLKGE